MDLSEIELGPKMQACSERERRFVIAYLRNGGRDATAAARDAGYKDAGLHSSSIRVRAHDVLHRERVIAALDEVGRKAFRGLMLPAIVALENALDDPKHPDNVKSALSVLSRLGLGENTNVNVNVGGEVSVNHTNEALEHLRSLMELGVPREKLIEMFGHSGLGRYEKMLAESDAKRVKVIEHREAE